MNYEQSSDRVLNSIINTYRRGSEPYRLALDTLQKRKRKRLRKPAKHVPCENRGKGKYMVKYGMSNKEIKELLNFKRAGTVGELHRTGLLKHCINVNKLRKAK